jgi:hypothetical protein
MSTSNCRNDITCCWFSGCRQVVSHKKITVPKKNVEMMIVLCSKTVSKTYQYVLVGMLITV